MYRIFCVEDDETIGKMIKKHLEKWNFEVHVAEDLSQIMTEFAAFDPQLVLIIGARKSAKCRKCR